MLVVGLSLVTAPAAAEWIAASPAVTAAATRPEIAAVLVLVNRMDQSLIDDDHAAFPAGDLVGEEIVVPKPPNPMAGDTVRRRFTDLWRHDDGGWRLAVRQATIIAAR